MGRGKRMAEKVKFNGTSSSKLHIMEEAGMNKHHFFAALLNNTDQQGNKIIYDNGTLYLFLKKDNIRRNIGVVKFHEDGNILYVKQEKEEGRFKKNDSWSINYYVLTKVDYVMYVTTKAFYKITKPDALKLGSFLWFKYSGYERKIYVPVKHWWSGG